MQRVALAFLTLGCALFACDVRPPGPNEEDRGKVTYWELTSSSIAFESCSDEPAFRNGFRSSAQLEGTFVTYRVSEDGKTATDLRCETTDPSTCTPRDPPRTYTINRNTLFSEGPLRTAPVVGISCEQFVRTDRTIVDQGDNMRFNVSTEHMLTGTATGCEELDQVFIGLGSNGFGLKDCVVTISARGENRGVR